MKKLLLATCVAASLFAGEIEFGKGSFNMDASFLGLNSSKNENITSISLVAEHKNIFSTNFFYAYKLAYFKSNTLTTSSNYLDSLITKALPVSNNNLTAPASTSNSTPTNTATNTAPANSSNTASNTATNPASALNSAKSALLIYNKLRGVDLNIVLGRDFINSDDRDTYFGGGLLIGASFPYLKTSSSNNNNNNTLNYLKKSKTKFYTYKIGLDLKGSKAINKIISFYASGAYAFQTARVKNSVLNLDSSSSGNYMTFNGGVKFQAKTHTKIWFMNLSPNVFATLGYRYDYWKVNNVKIDSLKLNTDINLKVSQIYAGIGYDF